MIVMLMRAVLVLGGVFWMLSCSSQGESSRCLQDTSVDYLGTWKRSKGEKTLTIYAKDEGLFLKYKNGSTYPLKFESEGRYFYAVTPLGNVPLLLDKGILTINNGFEVKYQRVN